MSSGVRRIHPYYIVKATSILRIGCWVGSAVLFVLLVRGVTTVWMQSETNIEQVKTAANEALSAPETVGTLRRETKDKDYSLIAQRPIFGVLGRPTPIAPPPPPAPQKPKSPLLLAGTYVASPRNSHAIIEDPRKSVQEIFRVGDDVFGEAKLSKIFSDRIEIERDGARETLYLDGASGGGAPAGPATTSVSGTDVNVAEADVDEALSNLPVLLTQIRAVPYFKDGAAIGLRLFAIKSGSLFEKIGLKNGDILKSINANSLGDFSQALKLFEKLKAERTLKVVLERNREEQEYTYMIR